MSSYIKKIIVTILLLGVVAMAVFSWFIYQTIFSPNTSFNNEEAHVYISSDASFNEVLQDLEPLLQDISSFETVAVKKEYHNNIKPGHFIIKKGMNNNDIVNAIRSNNVPIVVKYNNQERLENLAGHLSNQLDADSLSLLQAMKDSIFLKKAGFTPETALGMYIPNSYEVYWNTSPEAFRDKMLTEYNRFWNVNRNNKAKKIGLSRDQVMALAAIVQKETAKVEERPRVAGVYINRINKGMPLQADPTVIYAKKITENDFNQVIKRVLYKDLEIDSKYNTYKYTGVPPGPIFMPDISAIDGVLNYEQHDYFYFVADVTNFGYHKFAKTLSQHNQNKMAYVRWVNENGVNR
jgi:UPF0755 protein